jgi:hypothetical protein
MKPTHRIKKLRTKSLVNVISYFIIVVLLTLTGKRSIMKNVLCRVWQGGTGDGFMEPKGQCPQNAENN